MAKDKNWIQQADLKEGSFTKWCDTRGFGGVNSACIAAGKKSKDSKIRKRAILAETFRKMAKREKK